MDGTELWAGLSTEWLLAMLLAFGIGVFCIALFRRLHRAALPGAVSSGSSRGRDDRPERGRS